jgi:hypothetical protein
VQGCQTDSKLCAGKFLLLIARMLPIAYVKDAYGGSGMKRFWGIRFD